MKKRIFTLLALSLALVCIFATSVFAATLTVDGKSVELCAYNISGNNYFKLRDIAIILNGTKAQFDVTYDDVLKAANLKTGAPYSSDTTIKLDMIENAVAAESNTIIYKDGGKILAGAYNIGGNNFFKLRDLAAIFDFAVEWDDATKTIGINTNKKYEFPAPSGNFELNLEYVSYIGKTKAEMDSKFGKSTPIIQSVATYLGPIETPVGDEYSNGLKTRYNNDYIITKIEAPLSLLFSNCPDVVSRKLIEDTFFETDLGGYTYVSANVYGGTLTIPIDKDGNATPDTIAELSYNTYQRKMTKVVHVGREWENTVIKSDSRLYQEFFRYHEESGMFSKKTDPSPAYRYYDFNKDGTKEVRALDYGSYDEEAFNGRFIAIYAIVNGEVKEVYRLLDNEYVTSYTDFGSEESKTLIARVVDDQVTQFYELNVFTGKLKLYSTIKYVTNYDTYVHRLWLNGKEIAYGTEQYDRAFVNYAFGGDEEWGNAWFYL